MAPVPGDSLWYRPEIEQLFVGTCPPREFVSELDQDPLAVETPRWLDAAWHTVCARRARSRAPTLDDRAKLPAGSERRPVD